VYSWPETYGGGRLGSCISFCRPCPTFLRRWTLQTGGHSQEPSGCPRVKTAFGSGHSEKAICRRYGRHVDHFDSMSSEGKDCPSSYARPAAETLFISFGPITRRGWSAIQLGARLDVVRVVVGQPDFCQRQPNSSDLAAIGRGFGHVDQGEPAAVGRAASRLVCRTGRGWSQIKGHGRSTVGFLG